LGRIVSSLFMRVNSKCAHQVRPPLEPVLMDHRRRLAVDTALKAPGVWSPQNMASTFHV